MGMLDSIYAPCPICGKLIEFQNKAGECTFKKYNYKNVPVEIAKDLDKYGCGYDIECCNKKWKLVLMKPIPRVEMVIKEIDQKDEWD